MNPDLECKYSKAVELLRSSALSKKDICSQCGIVYSSFMAFLKARHPELSKRQNKRKTSDFILKKKRGAEEKYRHAIKLYETTNLSLKEIAEKFGFSPRALGKFINTNHRALLLNRKGIGTQKSPEEVKLRKAGFGQNFLTHEKYRDAIEACDSEKFIAYSISEIAKSFSLSPSGLHQQLRSHYPEIVERREKRRRELELSGNFNFGQRESTYRKYKEAIEFLRENDMKIQDVACRFSITEGGLRTFILAYHKDLAKERAQKRRAATGDKTFGTLNGIGALSFPHDETVEKYEEALKLFRTTSLSVKEIAAKLSLPPESINAYLNRWQRKALIERHGQDSDKVDEFSSLYSLKLKRIKTAEKYARAIRKIKEGNRSFKEIEKEFGLTDSFRQYLHRHEPELAAKIGSRKRNPRK